MFVEFFVINWSLQYLLSIYYLLCDKYAAILEVNNLNSISFSLFFV